MEDKYRVYIAQDRSNTAGEVSNDPETFAETTEGDLVFSADGDLLLPTDVEQVVQRMKYVCQTRLNSSRIFRGIGTRLRSFRGFAITEPVLQEMEETLMEDLVNSNVGIVPGSLSIDPVDIEKGKLLISFSLENPGQSNLYFDYFFDVDHGYIEQAGGGQI